MSVNKLAKRVSELRRKVAKTEVELQVLRSELHRAVDRHELAMDSSKVEVRAK